MKAIVNTWEEANIEELSAVARISSPLFRVHEIEDVKAHLININERFPSDFVIEARDDDDELVGWLSFEKTTDTMGEIGRWQPHILDMADREDVFRSLLHLLTNLAESLGTIRIEVGYGEVSEKNIDEYNERAEWLESEGFLKLEDNLFLDCSLSQCDLVERPLQDDIEFQFMSKMEVENLFQCYKESFSVSEHRQFFDYTTEQIREAYDDFFDLTKSFNDEASLVLVKDGQVIGFSLVRPRQEEEHLDMFGIHPNYRRRDLAKALILKSMKTVLDQGTDRMSIGVDAVNEPAVKLYEKVGFILVSRMIVHSWKKTD
ncbi:MAG: GNAT family N-acetyltransferase [Candidatus Thorarchaeota archaeon]